MFLVRTNDAIESHGGEGYWQPGRKTGAVFWGGRQRPALFCDRLDIVPLLAGSRTCPASDLRQPVQKSVAFDSRGRRRNGVARQPTAARPGDSPGPAGGASLGGKAVRGWLHS